MCEEPEITRFKEYLRIKSVHPNVDYDGCVKFLEQQCKELQLPTKIIELHPENPILIATWKGENPSLPALLLNSHMDVVPVEEDKWDYPPFEAQQDEKGNIYSRGSQDMKCVTMQYLEAIRRLKDSGVNRLKRTVHLSFVPDEEVGGIKGMKDFVKSDNFKKMNIGFSLDEGSSSLSEVYNVYYGEKVNWHIDFKCTGTPSHGSVILPNSVVDKVAFIMEKMMSWRKSEVMRMYLNQKPTFSDITTVNLTQISGGLQRNIVPSEMTLSFDLRIALDVDLVKLEQKFQDWCNEAKNTELIFNRKNEFSPSTIIEKNPWVDTFKKVADDLNLKTDFKICPGNTDNRYIRAVGISALGFSPINLTPPLLHSHNEYINDKTFLYGIKIYEKLIHALANLE